MLNEDTNHLLNTLGHGSGDTSAFDTCRKLAEHVHLMIDGQREEEVMTCMARMLDIYQTLQAPVVRTAIENAFIYSLGNYMIAPEQRSYLMLVLPDAFGTVLREQIIHSGI